MPMGMACLQHRSCIIQPFRIFCTMSSVTVVRMITKIFLTKLRKSSIGTERTSPSPLLVFEKGAVISSRHWSVRRFEYPLNLTENFRRSYCRFQDELVHHSEIRPPVHDVVRAGGRIAARWHPLKEQEHAGCRCIHFP